jgi:IS4 transposase
VFLTNYFKLAAKTIADIYKARWQVELFFRWIKQNLKVTAHPSQTKSPAQAHHNIFPGPKRKLSNLS